MTSEMMPTTAIPLNCSCCGIPIGEACFQWFSGYPYHLACLPTSFTKTPVVRTPAPVGDLAALAEAWVEAAEYHQQLAREMPGMLDERKLGLACADAMERKEIARAAFHAALAAHLAEVRAAIEPLRALHVAQVAAWPASEQWDDRCSIMVDWPVVCRLAALAKKLEG